MMTWRGSNLVRRYAWLLDELSQITFVLGDMSQKGAICSKIIWTICQILFSTWTICHTFILDDLSQVIFVLDDRVYV